MIQSVGQSPISVYASQAQTRAIPSSLPENKGAYILDTDKLFSPSEQKTMENLKQYMESKGTGQKDIQLLEGQIITLKLAQQTALENISIHEIIGRQIRGISEGFLNGNHPPINLIQNIYDNSSLFQGVDITA